MKLRRLQFISVFFASGACFSAAHAQEQKTDIYSAFDEQEKIQHEKRDAGAESVAHAIRAALVHDPRIDIANSRLGAAKADRFRAFGQFLPDIEASASYTNADLRSQTLPTLVDRDGTTIGLVASQPVFQGLSALNRLRESRSRFTQSDFALLAARQGTALQAARAHASVVLARAIVEHRIDNLSLLNRQFEITDRRMKAGAQSRTGVEQARMRRAQAQVDLAQARAVLADREAAYERIIGHAPPPNLDGQFNEKIIDFASLEDAQSAAMANNPTLNAARASVKAVEHAKNAAKGDFAPKLSVEGSYFKRFGQNSLMTAQDEEYQLVARMRMPIFRQGRNIAAIRSAGASISEEHGLMVNTQLAIEEAVTRSWWQIFEVKARRIAAGSGIEAAALSVKGLQMEYEAGRRTVIDVLNGQRDLVIASINLSQAEFDLAVSQYELAAATGLILGYADETTY
jgi:outer membrane protein